MFDKIKILTEIIDSPFALFQERNCIFESKLPDKDVLSSFSKNFWDTTEMNTINLNYFRGLLFISVKFYTDQTDFLLTLVFSESKTNHFEATDWDFLFKKVEAYVAILTSTHEFSIKKNEHSHFSYHHKKDEVGMDESTHKEVRDYSENYEFEQTFIHALKTGDPILLNNLLKMLSANNKTKLSTNELREKKYRLVALITLITRAAITYGCSAGASYRLSDSLIRQLDSIESDKEIPNFIKYLLNEYTLLIQSQASTKQSIIVKQVMDYVQRNLYQKISNQEIANEFDVHPAYLSSLFKKSTGISLRKFINQAKIEESKYLLSKTDISFQEISESLHFSNQSYFCKLFKEETTYTPKEFRILF